jgi:pyridoxal phosphate enzyme (YggS family)
VSGRAAELAANLDRLRERIARACAAAGRDPAEVTVVAVTKTWPADDIRRLVALGVRNIGENRDQEARGKVAELADLDVRWHFVGRLQRNKCRSVAGYASLVHSVDRPRLVAALNRAAEAADRVVPVLVQVGFDPTPGRGGTAPADVADLAAAVAAAERLRLSGLMTVAPPTDDPDAVFARLAELAHAVAAAHPGADVISAGMSADLESAVRHGATHVRIGSALLGHRSAPVG